MENLIFKAKRPNPCNCCRGQALIEIILLLPLLVIIMSMITWYTRLLLTRQMLLTAARYGTDIIYYSHIKDIGKTELEDKVKHWVEIYLTHPQIEGRRLNKERLKIKVIDNRPDPVTPVNAIIPINPFGLHDEASIVEVAYEFGMPTIFTAFSRYIPGGGGLPDKITIAARSAVLAGTMSKK